MTVLPICMYGQTFFTDGMTWRTKITSTSAPEPQSIVEISRLDGIENIDGVNALRMYCEYDGEANSKSLSAYIRTDGDKVYFRPVGSETKDWYLMYDFALDIGKGCYVFSPVYKDNDGKPMKSYIKNIGISQDDYNKLSLINLEEYEDETCTTYIGKGEWIKGVSSKLGVNYNIGFSMDGAGTGLLEASNGDNIVYKYETTAISGILSTSPQIRTIGLNLYISSLKTEDTVKVYSVDGTQIGVYSAKDNSVNILLPHDGTYILKYGDVSEKISTTSGK